DHRAAAGDDADVAGGGHGPVGAGEEDEVAGLNLRGGHLTAVGPLILAGARDGDPGGAVGHHGQPGAVEGVRPGGAPLVGLADLGFGVGDDFPGGPGGQWPEVGLLTDRAARGGEDQGAVGGVACRPAQDVGDVPVGVVVGEQCRLDVTGGAVGFEECGGGGDGVAGVIDVGDPVVVAVDAVSAGPLGCRVDGCAAPGVAGPGGVRAGMHSGRV